MQSAAQLVQRGWRRLGRIAGRRNALERRALKADPPTILTIETSSVCNLRCVMCPHAIGAVERPKRLPHAIADTLSGFIATAHDIQLHGIGEPLFSSAFWNLLDALPPGRNATVNTNMTMLSEAQARTLGASNLRLINVSLDAASEETYRFIRGHELQPVLDNVDRLNRYRRDGMMLAFNMTIMRCNYLEIPALVELAAERNAEVVYLWHLHRWDDQAMARYEIDRGDRHFSYAREGMWDEVDRVREVIGEARSTAARHGIKIELDHNKEI